MPKDQLRPVIDDIFALGLQPLRFDIEISRVVATATAAGMSGYDATYYAFAVVCRGEWLTFDSAAAKSPRFLNMCVY